MYNTLKIGVFGMIEGKKQDITHKKKSAHDDDYEEEEAHGDMAMIRSGTSVSTSEKVMSAEQRIKELEKQNADL